MVALGLALLHLLLSGYLLSGYLLSGCLVAAVGQQDLHQQNLVDVAELFEAGSVDVHGRRYPYRLLVPRASDLTCDRALLVFLHGAGERGHDNVGQLKWLPESMVKPSRRQQYPCFLLAVQCPVGERWAEQAWQDPQPGSLAKEPTRALRAVQQAIAEVLLRPGVDRARIYVTGLSMGGFGTWDLIARNPDRFAAAVSVCGGGDPSTVRRLLALPVEIWHGAADSVVPVQRSRIMAEQYIAFGLPVRYFERAGVGHDIWRQAYADGAALEWLFAQDQRQQLRGAFAEVSIIPRPDLLRPTSGIFRQRVGSRCLVQQDLRGLASFFLDALHLDAVHRPGLVDGVVPVAGDIVIELQPSMDSVYRLEVSDMVRLVAKHRAGVGAGLAALYQGLHTRAGGGLPRGVYGHRADLIEGWLRLGLPDGKWQRETFAQLLHACWLGSVHTICFEGGGRQHATARAWDEFVVGAKLLGIAVHGQWPETFAPMVVRSSSGMALATVLGCDVLGDAVPAGEAARLAVEIATATPEHMLHEVRRLLPATLERARHRRSPVHMGSFLARWTAGWR